MPSICCDTRVQTPVQSEVLVTLLPSIFDQPAIEQKLFISQSQQESAGHPVYIFC